MRTWISCGEKQGWEIEHRIANSLCSPDKYLSGFSLFKWYLQLKRILRNFWSLKMVSRKFVCLSWWFFLSSVFCLPLGVALFVFLFFYFSLFFFGYFSALSFLFLFCVGLFFCFCFVPFLFVCCCCFFTFWCEHCLLFSFCVWSSFSLSSFVPPTPLSSARRLFPV